MYNGCLYLNNHGSRWIIVKDGKRDMSFILITENGERKKRQADFYESFGNFASVYYRYKGKRYSALFEDFERDEKTGLPIVKHSKWIKKD